DLLGNPSKIAGQEGFHRNVEHWVTCLLQGVRRGTCHACSRPSAPTLCVRKGAGEPHWRPANPGCRTDGGAHVTVESTAPRKPRRSAGTKSTAGKTTTARKSPSTDPELVQLLTPEGERVNNAEYDEYVAGITPDE